MQCNECGIDDAMYDRLLEEIERLEKENETLKAIRDELFDRLGKEK